MKLVLITFRPFWYDGEKYSPNLNFINFLLAFKKHFKEIVLLAHIRHTQHEKIYLKDYQCVSEGRQGIDHYFNFYNHERPLRDLRNSSIT